MRFFPFDLTKLVLAIVLSMVAVPSLVGTCGARATKESVPVADADRRHDRSALGLSAGIPQGLALTYDTPLDGRVRFQAHLFTLLVYTSVGARAILPVPDWPVRPYAFGGFGLTHQAVGRYDAPAGGAGFLWWGGGIRWWMGPVLGFVELSRLSSSAWNADDLTMGAAVGLLWSWGD